MKEFGTFARARREALRKGDPAFSLRKVAERIGVQPSYLSRVERGLEAPPSEETIVRWADEINVDRDVMLAIAGKISSDLVKTITKRPELFAELIRELNEMPDHAILRIVREVRDGEW
jgi:transcriptional regulator with XRE-family HTH domain